MKSHLKCTEAGCNQKKAKNLEFCLMHRPYEVRVDISSFDINQLDECEEVVKQLFRLGLPCIQFRFNTANLTEVRQVLHGFEDDVRIYERRNGAELVLSLRHNRDVTHVA